MMNNFSLLVFDGGQYLCLSLLMCFFVVLIANLLHRKRVKRAREPKAETLSPSEEEAPLSVAASVEVAVASASVLLPPQAGMEAATVAAQRKIRGRYNKSFTAKLMQSSETVKSFYAALANELLSYEKIKAHIGWANASFFGGRRVLAKFSIRGKTLYLHLRLPPQEFENTKYAVTDVSAVKRYALVPLRIKVKSCRGVKFAKELIAVVMQKNGLLRLEDNRSVSESDFPFDTTKNLLACGLIKAVTADKSFSGEEDLLWDPFERRSRITAEEAHALPSVAEEKSLPGKRTSGKRFAVNIDTLSAHFLPEEIVTVERMKEKGLVPQSAKAVKILARGTLDKALTVEADDFSADAIKMIVLTGGTAKNRYKS